MWERSGQGEGGFLHEEEEAQMGLLDFGSLAGRSENALSNRANFVGENDLHILYLWDLIDKYELMKSCMQVIRTEFAAKSGDNVRAIYNSKRAQLKDDDDDDASSISSKQTKSEMFIGGSIMIQEKKAKLEGLVRDESDMTKTPLKSNVTPTSHRQGQMDEAM